MITDKHLLSIFYKLFDQRKRGWYSGIMLLHSSSTFTHLLCVSLVTVSLHLVILATFHYQCKKIKKDPFLKRLGKWITNILTCAKFTQLGVRCIISSFFLCILTSYFIFYAMFRCNWRELLVNRIRIKDLVYTIYNGFGINWFGYWTILDSAYVLWVKSYYWRQRVYECFRDIWFDIDQIIEPNDPKKIPLIMRHAHKISGRGDSFPTYVRISENNWRYLVYLERYETCDQHTQHKLEVFTSDWNWYE